MIFSIALLAVSLSLDALFVGFAYGLKGTRIPLKSKLIISFFSVIYAGAALFAGKSLSLFLSPTAGKFIGAGILALIGVSMIVKPLIKKHSDKSDSENEDEFKTLARIFIRSLGITIQILKNPQVGDLDRSGVIDTKESLLLGLALSIDAIGVGIGSALSGLSSWQIPLVIGLCQLFFLSAGLFAGKHLSFFKTSDDKFTTLIPGLCLIALSVARLF